MVPRKYRSQTGILHPFFNMANSINPRFQSHNPKLPARSNLRLFTQSKIAILRSDPLGIE